MPRDNINAAADRLVAILGWEVCDDPQSLFDWAGRLGEHMLLIPGEDPDDARDAAAVGPRLAEVFRHRFDCAVVQTEADGAVRAMTGQRRVPTFVFFRDGRQLGAVGGALGWADRIARVQTILECTPQPEPEPAFA
ncbi:MAG: hypothetical protein AAFU61_09810 [Pseudomonadota bacterium]